MIEAVLVVLGACVLLPISAYLTARMARLGYLRATFQFFHCFPKPQQPRGEEDGDEA